MRGAVMYGPRDIRVVDRDVPQIVEPTDAVGPAVMLAPLMAEASQYPAEHIWSPV